MRGIIAPLLAAGIALSIPIPAWAQFTPAPNSPFTAGAGPGALAVADFNNDGNLDLAVADTTGSSTTVTILLGSANGSFAAAPSANPIAIANPTSIVAADFNGDGYYDLAVASLTGKMIMVYFGKGDGTFKPGAALSGVSNPPAALVAYNFEGKGCIDLAVAFQVSAAGSNVSIFPNTPSATGGCTGTFPSSPIPAAGSIGTNPVSMAEGNFMGPGLAVANELDGTVSVLGGPALALLANVSVTTQTPQAPSKPFPVSIAVADVNGDGLPDIVTANQGTNNISVLLNSSSGQFTPAPGSPVAVGTQPVSVVIGDFNRDGKADIAVANYGSANVTVLLGLGNGAFQAPVNLPSPSPVALATGDFNNDGSPDLAIANLTNNNVSVFLSNCCSVTMLSSASGAHLVAPGSLVSIYGSGLATAPLSANPTALPTSLGGTSVIITYSNNQQDFLQLYYVSPTQINALMPLTAVPGPAVFTIDTPTATQFGNVSIDALAPAIFSANENGTGVAWAEFVNPSSAFANAFQCPTIGQPGGCIPLPWNVSTGGSYLVLYTTGLHSANVNSNPSEVQVTIGSQTLTPTYAGPSTFAGEDQVNVALPTYTTSPGVVPVSLKITEPNGTIVYSNTVTIYLTLSPG